MVALFDCRRGVEVITGLRATIDSVPRASSITGSGPDFSTQRQAYNHSPSFAITGPMSIVVLCDVDALTGYGALIAKQDTSTTYCPYELRLGNAGSTDSQLQLLRASAGAYATVTTGADKIAAGDKGVLLIATASSDSIKSNGAFWVGGAKTTITDGDANLVADNEAPVFIGRRSDGATQLDGRIFYIALFNRALSDPEAREMSDRAKRWSVFEDRRIWVPIVAPAVAPTLSLPTVTSITATTARPRVTVTF